MRLATALIFAGPVLMLGGAIALIWSFNIGTRVICGGLLSLILGSALAHASELRRPTKR